MRNTRAPTAVYLTDCVRDAEGRACSRVPRTRVDVRDFARTQVLAFPRRLSPPTLGCLGVFFHDCGAEKERKTQIFSTSHEKAVRRRGFHGGYVQDCGKVVQKLVRSPDVDHYLDTSFGHDT